MPKQSNIPAIHKSKLPHAKIDIAEALKLRLTNGLTYQEIADRYNCKRQSVYGALQRYIKTIDTVDKYKPLLQYKQEFLDVAEIALLADTMNPEKRAAASLNNTAYAFNTIHQANRLEKDKSTSNQAITCRWLGEGDDDK